jgi:hypothetical protein
MVAGAQALMNGVVFAVHREKSDAMAGDGRHYNLSGGNEDFFIREGDILALLDRLVGGGQASNTDSGRDDRVRVRVSGDAFHSFRTEQYLDWFVVLLVMNGRAELSCGIFGGNGNNFGMMAGNLFGDERHVGAGGKRDNLKSARERIHNAQTLAPDGTGGTQNRNSLHAQLIL